MKIWQTWIALKRDKTKWFDFIITDIKNLNWDNLYTVKITNWKNELKNSCIWDKEIDEYLIFN